MSRPRIGFLGSLHTGQQILLPQEPFLVTATLAQLDRSRGIGTTAGNKELHIPLFVVRGVIAFYSGVQQPHRVQCIACLAPLELDATGLRRNRGISGDRLGEGILGGSLDSGVGTFDAILGTDIVFVC